MARTPVLEVDSEDLRMRYNDVASHAVHHIPRRHRLNKAGVKSTIEDNVAHLDSAQGGDARRRKQFISGIRIGREYGSRHLAGNNADDSSRLVAVRIGQV